MSALVVDTHTAIWYLLDVSSLSPNAFAALDEAAEAGDSVYLTSISMVEVIYLVEKGRLPPSALEKLNSALAEPDAGFVLAPLDLGVIQALRQIPRDLVPDMPDRIIAATALHLNLPLVTRDSEIRGAGIKTIW